MAVYGIIVAAGLGTRHRHLTNPYKNRYARPKAMLRVADRVLIDFSIEALKALGLNKIFVGASLVPRFAYSDVAPDIITEMERHINNRDIYEIEIQMDREREILGTAGTVKYLMENFMTGVRPDDTIVVLPCDTAHNIKLKPILEAHLRTGAAITMATLPFQWTEWNDRNFGTVQLAGMPALPSCQDRNLFEVALRQWAKDHQGESLEVAEYLKREQRDSARSNLVNTGIYFFNAGFLMDLFPSVTPQEAEQPVSDFGLHVFPLLGKERLEELQHHVIDPTFINNIWQRKYPFYAYLVPEEGTYWEDVANPSILLKVNRDVLAGKLDTQLSPRFWHRQPWGWLGNFDTSIQSGATIVPPQRPGDLGSLIDSHAGVGRRGVVDNSVVGGNVTVDGEVVNSVIFPGSERERIIIGKGVRVSNSIVTGGEIYWEKAPRTDKAPRTIEGDIVYVDPESSKDRFAFTQIARGGR